jgi:transcriptional repressor NrdR
MLCPYCGGDTRVEDSRSRSAGVVRRRRRCLDLSGGCGRIFSTSERVAAEELVVRKRDGSQQPYSRAKLVRSLSKAAWIHNKNKLVGQERVTPKDINAVAERVEAHLRSSEAGQLVSSVEIGGAVLRELEGTSAGMDIVRVRYAIVFHGHKRHRGRFRSVRGFVEWLEEVHGPPAYDERPPDTPWLVKKRNGRQERFQLGSVARSIGVASKGHGNDEEVRAFADRLAAEVKHNLEGQVLVTSQQIAAEVLKLLLRERDALAYLRYASAVKGYSSVDEFWLEAYALDPDAM